MSTENAAPSKAAEPVPGARQLARGITATWWYTASAVMFFELFLVLFWTGIVFGATPGTSAGLVVGIGGLIWCASTVPLLAAYRHRIDAEPGIAWISLAMPLFVAVGFGGAAGIVGGSWLLGVMPVAQFVVLLNWPRGVRYRIVIAITLLLVCVAFIDTSRGVPAAGVAIWLPLFYTIMLPAMTVSSLWWWDVLIALDRARASEAKLAATQERLRVATDVHDLQGHHLQVIALQLELAERLMPRDADAGMAQLRAARVSVDEARQGTRDLATRFRSVPLSDELANARDLLRAAGLDVTTDIAADADSAPASDLGPVIRETTTNVLRHGAGTRARLTLVRTQDVWRYEISNDVLPGADTARRGSGLEGIGRRVDEAKGTLDVRRDEHEFSVIVMVPADSQDAG
ncbi:histidine kinase [Microbacterium sp.]|uniref:sensor histidine kinase n=1 Tax=Microbacterium sp. TaxID=51671 RepID=UPI0028127FAF|nr:histidine kinase [Microbacterium sp.]